MPTPQLCELLEDLHKGGSACAVLLDFDATEKQWKHRDGGGVEVFESAGECCFSAHRRLWVFDCPQSGRWEVLGIWLEDDGSAEFSAYRKDEVTS